MTQIAYSCTIHIKLFTLIIILLQHKTIINFQITIMDTLLKMVVTKDS